MAPYFIDGAEAQGEDYAKAIEALPSVAECYPAEVCFGTSDQRRLLVCGWPDRLFRVIDNTPDGSEWRSQTLGEEQVKAIVASFLNGEEWRKGLQWELQSPATKNDRLRMLAVLLAAILILGLATWNSGFFYNRGVHSQPPVQSPVYREIRPKDLAGTWYYRGATPGTVCEINLNANGTYSLIHRRSNTASTNTGDWTLTGDAHLFLYPFYTASISRPGAVDITGAAVGWRLTVSNNLVSPFGGDSLDPGRWAVLSRAAVAPLPPLPQPIPVAATRRWFAIVTAFALVLSVSVAFLWWRARTKLPAKKQEWSSGSNVASAILPQIERLRGRRLSGAPVPAHHTPAHKGLIATARRLVAQFAYFRKQENPDSAPPHEKQDDTA